MKKSEYNGKERAELTKTLAEKQKALNEFYFSLSGGKAKNVKEGSKHRKEVARILTALNANPKA